MAIREAINSKPQAAAGLAGAAVLVAIGLIFWQAMGDTPGKQRKAYFSIDDGKTYFVDDIDKPYPFDHNGKPAFRAYVYRCGNGDPFVGYLEGYTDSAKARLADLQSKPADTENLEFLIADVKSSGTEAKKPGDDKWAPVGSGRWAAILAVKCPDGQPATPQYP